MKRLKRHVVRMRVRLAGMGIAARFAAGTLAALVLGGAVWLVWAMVSPEPMVAIALELDADARDRAVTALEREGISFRRTEGGLKVSPHHLSDARRILRSDVMESKSSASSLRQLANSSSMWRSSAENRRIWQAGVMAELGRMVTGIDPVESASVLFEPGSPGGLGAEARAAGAAVKVTLARGRRMSPALVVAIGELVSGSIAVEIGDVRVVDQSGRSYRPSPEAHALAHRHAIEAYYSGKIMSALRYIPGISADVQIIGAPVGLRQPAGEGLRVWVSVPRSYLSTVGNEESSDQQLAAVKDAARAVLPPGGSHEVTVALHGPGNAPESSVSQTHAGVSRSMFLTAMIASAVVGGLGLWLLLRCRALVARKPDSIGPPVSGESSDESSDELGYEMLAPFSDGSSDDRIGGLGGEHPQTLALIMVRIPSAQAAEIMARLPAELRAEVARRMGDLGDVDPAVVSEIRRDLARRLDSPVDGLSSQPGGYENIDRRRAERDALRLLVFEDVMLLGAGELRAALGAVEPDDLAISLRMAGKQVRRKVLGCLSRRNAEFVQARMDLIGPMRICDVESARRRVMEAVSHAAGVPQAPGETACGEAMEEAV
ncbi:MAG: hypothetical protein ISS69_12175 [Phycisphaerae bacterium]|nr:hypothetical protein [Phycisphaerae bacterium]